MDRFVRELLSHPVLPADEEAALARAARAGDGAARDALIVSGLRSVALRATMLGLRGEDLRDGVQSGIIGLIRAVDRFDPDRGARLATYAWRWIGAEMGRGRPPSELPLEDLEPTYEDPHADVEDLLRDLSEEAADVVRRRLGLDPASPFPLSRRAVGEQLGLTVSQVRTIEAKAMRQLRRGLAKVVDRAPLPGGADPP